MHSTNPSLAAEDFAPWSARRLLILAGLALILAGLILGDIFAVFILHPNAARIGENLLGATEAVAAGNADAVRQHFQRIGAFLENRGTKVDTHVHIIVFGYLALLLALVQPYVAFRERARRRWAVVFVIGAALLPVCVFLIPYVGLAGSPLEGIGWASILADLGGLLVILACAAQLAGLWRHFRSSRRAARSEGLPREKNWTQQALLAGGTLLVLAGFAHGAWYAAFDREQHEVQDAAILRAAMSAAAAGNRAAASAEVGNYGGLQASRAVKIAAHAHVIEFGILAMLLAFIQPWVFLSEKWKRRWAAILLAGSVLLPLFVLAELWWGLLAGGIADVGGLMVILSLTGMLAGVLRATGQLDAAAVKPPAPGEPAECAGSAAAMDRAQKLLIVGGLLLTLWGMSYGLYYALFDEHQTLERIGERLAASYAHAARREMPQAHAALDEYAAAKFEYVREVDVHSHWSGLAVLLFVLGLMFDRLGFEERRRLALAIVLIAGSFVFPFGVILQTVSRGALANALAAGGAGVLIAGLAVVAYGFSRD